MIKAAITLGAIALVSAGCGGSPEGHVPMPPDDASPAVVVRSYVAALNAHDTRTVRRLTSGSPSDTWLGSVGHISDLRITDVAAERPRWSGQPRGTAVRNVAVRFNVEWAHHDGTMGDGPTDWSYLLAQDRKTGRWRIFDEGMG